MAIHISASGSEFNMITARRRDQAQPPDFGHEKRCPGAEGRLNPASPSCKGDHANGHMRPMSSDK
jgi:hypothetical protein